MKNKKATPVPFYAKVGWITCWLLMLVLITMIFRNCVGSIKYGSATSSSEIEYYYQQGYSDAVQTGISRSAEMDKLNNPLLKKSYVKGFREGLGADAHDVARKEAPE